MQFSQLPRRRAAEPSTDRRVVHAQGCADITLGDVVLVEQVRQSSCPHRREDRRRGLACQEISCDFCMRFALTDLARSYITNEDQEAAMDPVGVLEPEPALAKEA